MLRYADRGKFSRLWMYGTWVFEGCAHGVRGMLTHAGYQCTHAEGCMQSTVMCTVGILHGGHEGIREPPHDRYKTVHMNIIPWTCMLPNTVVCMHQRGGRMVMVLYLGFLHGCHDGVGEPCHCRQDYDCEDDEAHNGHFEGAALTLLCNQMLDKRRHLHKQATTRASSGDPGLRGNSEERRVRREPPDTAGTVQSIPH